MSHTNELALGNSCRLYGNCARLEQLPYLIFKHLDKYRQVKKKYDPNDTFTMHTSGHLFYAP